MKHLFFYITLSFFLTTCFVPLTRAQEASPAASLKGSVLRVSPVIINVKLEPGKTQEYEITLDNLSEEPVPVRLSFDSFETSDNGEVLFRQKPPEIESWSTIEPSQLIIDPNGRRTITLKVRVPETIPFGGYYGVLFVEPILPRNSSSPQVTGKIGIFLFATIGTQTNEKKGAISSWGVSPMVTDKGVIATALQVKNNDLIHFNAQPHYILDSYTGADFELEIPEKIVFPGKTRSWKQELQMAEYPYGIYQITARVSVGNGQQIQESQLVVSLPWKRGSGLLVVGIGLGILLTKRRQLKNVVRIMVKGK